MIHILWILCILLWSVGVGVKLPIVNGFYIWFFLLGDFYNEKSGSLFSSEEQRIRYTNLFSSRSIIDPKFIDMEFFSAETFDCIQAFQNLGLLPFLSLQLPIYPELVKAFYCNLEIQDNTLISEIFGIKMVIDQSLFYA